ncbi:MAG: MgtC/SapB family protein [Verrucomicrobia bacterium]|nr:MgtC/SapB family protein [Verrucomicrobiota bacterium]
MDLQHAFYLLGIALGLGLLVGLQRERSASLLAGIRTFPLVTVLGTVCAMLGQTHGGWVVGAGFVALAAVILSSNLLKIKMPVIDPGTTTEMALLLMYGVGAYLVAGHTAVAIAIGGGVAVLLYLKPEMHALAVRIGEADFKAVMQFVLITLVILPVLPDQAYGPYRVLNPHRIWLLVVLIVAISLAGYVAYKFLGQRAGAMLSGLLGGLISSTATTVSYARRSREMPNCAGLAAFVIFVASTILFLRVLVILAVVSRSSLAVTGPPLAAALAFQVLVCIVLWLRERHGNGEMPAHTNPTELRPALVFGAIFAVVLLATAAGKAHFDNRGLYVVAALSGLTDVDAITLSTAQMINDGRLDASVGWRLVLVASMANLIFKGAAVAVLGTRALLVRVVGLFILAFAAGVVILNFWPRV